MSAADPTLIQRSFLAMGTQLTVKLAVGAGADASAAEAVLAEVRALVHDFGRHWWAWGDGALAQINRELAQGRQAVIPAEMQPLFERAWQIRRLSGARFEPLIGALVQLWGFHDLAQMRTEPPDARQVRALLEALHAAPPYRGGTPYGPAPGVVWDFGAIGKGWIVDAALELLRRRGFADALFDAGGNLAARGSRGGRPWRVGIRDPRAAPASPQLLAALDVGDEAVITHGNDQRFFDYQGQRYAHVLDPATGMPVRGLHSITAVHADAALADAAGSALYVAGPQGWPPLARQLGLEQVLALMEDGSVRMTPALAARVTLRDDVPAEVVTG